MADNRVHKLLTPPINTAGTYSVYSPFTLTAGEVYRCSAIRSFSELEKRGIDVYTTYYAPKSIDEDTYKGDAELKASMVTLISSTGEEVYVPNTYIESYPGDSGVEYQHNVIVLDVGMVPATVDIEYVLEELADLARKATGATTTAEIVSVPYSGTVDNPLHVTLETARRAALAEYVSKDEKIAELVKTNTELLDTNAQLVALIEAHPEIFP